MFSPESFSDEFNKIAAARWKTLLRAGKLDPSDVSALRRLRVKDPAMESLEGAGQVRARAAHRADPKKFRKEFQKSTGEVPDTALNYRREIEGMDEGAEAIAKKKGIKIWEGTSDLEADMKLMEARKALDRRDFSGVLEKGKEYGKDVVSLHAGRAGGGGAALPGNIVALAPQYNAIALKAGVDPSSRAGRGVLAVTKKHEVNEQLAQAAQKAKKKRSGWTVHKAPENEMEQNLAQAAAEQSAPYRQMASGLSSGAEVAGKLEKAPLLGRLAKKVKSRLKGRSQKIQQDLVPEGHIVAGRHNSPDVIMRESKDVATMPGRARRAMREVRDPAEMKMMGGRFAYGTEAPRSVQRSIMKDFERGVI